MMESPVESQLIDTGREAKVETPAMNPSENAQQMEEAYDCESCPYRPVESNFCGCCMLKILKQK